MSWRSWIDERDHAGNAAFAAAMARSASAALARGNTPTTSSVFDGLMLGDDSLAPSHSPAM